MHSDAIGRRRVLKLSAVVGVAALAGCTGGADGNVESEIDGVSVSDVDTEETTVLGTDFLVVTGTISNENDEPVEVQTEGSFYDEGGAELDTETGCEEIAANNDYNGQLIGTDRIDDADGYEVTLVENDDFRC